MFSICLERYANEPEHINKDIKHLYCLSADTIDPCIRTTYDYCSNYADGRVPMLDLKIWIGKDENNEWKILHTHYMKGS